jgi:uncharacterized protein YndB with AHSA1/START domain
MTTIAEHELSLSRTINAPAEKIFRAWTTPELLVQWWAPLPYTTPNAVINAKPGGAFNTTMRGPEGEIYDNEGMFLDVVPNKRIVFTDAFREGWIPIGKPFMTGYITFEDAGNGATNYVARALHWTIEDMQTHQDLGFEEGWGTAADQLEALLERM